MTAYDTVVFDSDGVLVEPPAPETQLAAVRAAFEETGVTDPDRSHIEALRAGVTVDALEEVAAAYDLDPARLWAAREHHDEQFQFEKFRAGDRTAYDDVAAIDTLPQDCGVVSNNHHSTIEFVLAYFELGSLFETYYGREKTVESLELKKPDTHYLEQALADLGAGSPLYVGDSESDVRAARRAGIDSVFLRRSHCRDVSLTVAPTYEVADLHGVAEIASEGA